MNAVPAPIGAIEGAAGLHGLVHTEDINAWSTPQNSHVVADS